MNIEVLEILLLMDALTGVPLIKPEAFFHCL